MTIVATIPAPPTNGFEIGPLDVRLYGILIATGVLLAMTITRRRYVAYGGDGELADRVALWGVALGFVGARIAYVLPRVGQFAERPWAVVAVWEGGLALFGGLTLGTATVLWLMRRSGGDPLALLDAAAPAVPIAQALGRWGNYFNQELFGTPTTVPWALEVDPGYRPDRFAEFETFHPTFLYESLWNLGLAAFLVWLGRRNVLPKGALALVYFIGYAVARFALELLRTDTTFRLLGLSRNGWVSLTVVVVASVILGVWTSRTRSSTSRRGEERAPTA